MNKPRYMEGLFKIIFLVLGITFVFMGCLSYIGILKPNANSMVQESTVLGAVFGSLGLAFFIVQTVLQIIVANKNKLHSKLISSGNTVKGVVEKVCLQKHTQYGKKHPYRILYTYPHWTKGYTPQTMIFARFSALSSIGVRPVRLNRLP